MLIQVNAGDVEISDAIERHVHDEVTKALSHFGERVTRVEAHLRDLNGNKAGVDKRCTLEARLAGLDPLVVEETADDLYEAIRKAAKTLKTAVKHKLDRHEAHKSK